MIESVEAYLDRLFDLLAETGAAGRRVMLEAQGHLDEAVEAAKAKGLSQAAAERDAIQRFGAPEEVAQAHFTARALPAPAALGRIGAAAWLMTGVGGVAMGLMGLIDAAMARAFGAAFVADDSLAIINGSAVAGAVGALALAAFFVARQMPALRGATVLPNPAMVSTAGAVAFAGGGAVLLAYALLGYAFGVHDEVGQHIAEGAAALVAGLFFIPQAWRSVSTARG